jgi:hypothetical protein
MTSDRTTKPAAVQATASSWNWASSWRGRCEDLQKTREFLSSHKSKQPSTTNVSNCLRSCFSRSLRQGSHQSTQLSDVGRWGEPLKTQVPQHEEPELSVIHTIKQKVHHSFRGLRTQSAGIFILQPMTDAPVSSPAAPHQECPQELTLRWGFNFAQFFHSRYATLA